MAWPPRLPCSLCFLLLCFLLLIAVVAASGSGRMVTSLPGFDGRLPFHLETGYVEVGEANNGGAKLFYYFVQAESEPAAAPFVLWLTGGRRCSVLSGLAYEIGPIRFVLEPYDGTLPRLHYNQNSWTKVSYILFVDSPVGAGFSFSRDPKGYYDSGDISASSQLHEFVFKWFDDHPEYLANPFYIGGNSYAGKIVPFLAQRISEGIEAGMKTVPNLKGYLVGNPLTGESIDSSSKVPFAHAFGLVSDQLYETITEHCQGEEHANPANALCAQAMETFNNLIKEVGRGHVLLDMCAFASPVTNVNDIPSDDRKILREEIGVGQQLNHPPARPPFHCFNYRYYLSYFWENDRRTRDALGIKEGTVDEWIRCHDKGELQYAIDIKSSIKYHRNVTSRGYRALVYSGDHDPVVPHLGTQAWVRSLNFSVVDDWRAWHLDGQAAGFAISYSNNMTFATIKGGGHAAPEYEPEKCFAMFSRWIYTKPATLIPCWDKEQFIYFNLEVKAYDDSLLVTDGSDR